MAHAEDVSQELLVRVSQEVGAWLDARAVAQFKQAAGLSDSSVAPLAKADPAAQTVASALPNFWLNETFAVYTLGADDIIHGQQTGADLLSLAEPADRYHHQIRVDNQAVGFARTTIATDENGQSLCQLYLSELAPAIDAAIDWLDQLATTDQAFADSDPLVRLLFVPAFYVYAFWLIKEQGESSDVLVIKSPVSLQNLPTDRVISSQEFLAAFQHAHPGGGLVDSSIKLPHWWGQERHRRADWIKKQYKRRKR
jgi:hypothetical protein